MDQAQSWANGKGGRVLTAAIFLLALFLLVKTAGALKQLPYVGRDLSSVNTIAATGKGEAYAAPDIATFSFTVQHESLVVATAQQRVNKEIADILAYLKKNGVAEKDIRTSNYSVYPRYEYSQIRCISYPCPPSGQQTLAGYVVSQSISVKVRKITDAGKLVSGVGELGATEVSGLTFDVEDDEAVMRQARQEAIGKAKEHAAQLADDLGVRIVRVVSFSEGGNYPIYYAKDMAMGLGGAPSASGAASLPTGENHFVSNVTITYEIR